MSRALKILPMSFTGAAKGIEEMYDFGASTILQWMRSSISKRNYKIKYKKIAGSNGEEGVEHYEEVPKHRCVANRIFLFHGFRPLKEAPSLKSWKPKNKRKTSA